MNDDDKRAAALAAVAEVRGGMRIGLGTGTTAAFAIDAIGARVRDGLLIAAVATSQASAARARARGIPLLDMSEVDRLDLGIDGVDEIDPACRAIKGAGGALLREKIVAEACVRMIAIADGSKAVAALGKAALPVEVLPVARSLVASRIEALGGVPTLRDTDGASFRTDQGNIILDCRFAAMPDPAALATALSAIPGLLGHGLFLREIDAAYIARDGVVERRERRQ